jgi:hypothetical protein
MAEPVYIQDLIKVPTRRKRSSRLTSHINKLTAAQMEQLSSEAQSIYVKNLKWFQGQKKYLKDTQSDLRRMGRRVASDTYNNLKATEYRLDQQVKFMALWFNEIWRWFPLTQFKSGLIRSIVSNAINLYITTIQMPQWSYERGLVTEFREIEIVVLGINVYFKESHKY